MNFRSQILLLSCMALSHVYCATVWSQEAPRPARTLQQSACQTGVESLSFLSCGKLLATTNNNATVDIWNIDDGSHARKVRGRGFMVRALVPASNGVLIGGDRDGAVWVWRESEKTQRLGRTPVRHINSAGLAISSDEKVVFVPGKDSSVLAIDLATGKALHKYEDAFLNEVDFRYLSVSGTLLATGSSAQGSFVEENQIKVYHVDTKKVLHTFAGSGPLAISPDQSFLASLVDSRNVGVFDIATGKEKFRTRLTGNHFLLCVAISPDGKSVAFGGGDNTARVVDATSGKELFVLRHTSFVDSVAFSPDGQLLATGSRKGFVRIFNLKSGEVVAGYGAKREHESEEQ